MYRATLPGDATVWVTTRALGDFAESALSATCSMVHQIHGSDVRRVEAGQIGVLGDADALVSTSQETMLAVRGADCPLIGLSCPEGVIAAVHAGWRGLYAGVIEQAAAAIRVFGATSITAVLGPFIGVECYEFSEADLSLMVNRFGDAARGTTSWNSTALDLGACIDVSFERSGIARAA